MTENATESVEAAAPTVWEPKDAVSKAIVADLNEKATEHNALQAKVDAATGDNSALIAELRGTSENADVRSKMDKYDDLILKAEKILNEVDNLIKADLAASADLTPEQISETETQIKALRDDVKAGLNYLSRKYGDEVKSALTPLRGAKASKSGTGEGGTKIRLKAVYVDDVLKSATQKVIKTVKGEQVDTGETKVVSTFTLAAKDLPGVSVQDLTAAYLDAAKVTEWQKAPEIVEFSVTTSDGANHMIKACK